MGDQLRVWDTATASLAMISIPERQKDGGQNHWCNIL